MSETLRLAAPSGIAETILLRGVRVMISENPHLKVVIRDGQTPEVVENLKGKRVDLAIVGKDISVEGEIETQKLPHTEENILAVPISDLLALKDEITKEELIDILVAKKRILIGREKGSGVEDKAKKYLQSIGVNLAALNDDRVRVQSLEGSIRAVAAGIGVTIVPKGTAMEICPQYVKALRLPMGNDDNHNRRQFYVSWRYGHQLSGAESELCQVLGVREENLPSSAID